MDQKVAIFTDLHLGIKQDDPSWHEIALEWADWFISELDERNINDVIFLGDFFHNRSFISVNTLFATYKLLDKFSEKKLHFILGNHDLFYGNNPEISAVRLFEKYSNITVYTEPTLVETEWQNLLFFGWGYELLPEHKADTLLTHAEINVFSFNDNMPACNSGFKASSLVQNFTNVFAGHFHGRQFKEYMDCRIQYTGNPFPMDYSDRNVIKGFDIFDLKTREIEFVVNNISPKFVQYNLSDFILNDYEHLQTVIDNSFFKLIVDKNVTMQDANEILSLINSCNPRSSKLEWLNGQNFHQDMSGLKIEEFDLQNVIKEYINLLDIPNKDEVKDYMMELYEKCL